MNLNKNTTIHRFIEAQKEDHNKVVLELLHGKKQSCWMWWTFPQIKGLGYSETAKFYEFQCYGEVNAFVANEYLYYNIVELIEIIMELYENDPIKIFGPIDAKKLQSSMTVLSTTQQLKGYANAVLNKFFKGKRDQETLDILKTMEDR